MRPTGAHPGCMDLERAIERYVTLVNEERRAEDDFLVAYEAADRPVHSDTAGLHGELDAMRAARARTTEALDRAEELARSTRRLTHRR